MPWVFTRLQYKCRETKIIPVGFAKTAAASMQLYNICIHIDVCAHIYIYIHISEVGGSEFAFRQAPP